MRIGEGFHMVFGEVNTRSDVLIHFVLYNVHTSRSGSPGDRHVEGGSSPIGDRSIGAVGADKRGERTAIQEFDQNTTRPSRIGIRRSI